MQLVAFHLQGNTLTWFIRWEQEIGHPTWPQFSQAIDRRFGPPIQHNDLGDLTSTHQTGELDDYTNQFLLTVTKVTGLSTAQQVMLYTAGLASTLQIDIQLQQPPDLESAIAMARKFYISDKQKEFSHSLCNESHNIQISLNAVAGITTSQTMQVQISINVRDFLALLDSGSTHNFIDSDTADDLQLPRTRAPNSLSVTVANGDRISNVGIYNNLRVQIDTEIFNIDCYSIKLGGYDLVLGVNWLSSLGPIIWDFNNLTMKFWRHGRQIIWTSLGKPRPDQPRLHTLSPTATMEALLTSFSHLFRDPQGLPPQRRYDHRIHLKDPSKPTTVRPYRYPHLQKAELEKQCQDMLAQGIIRYNTSPFSSPVLLVKKQDGS